jgi:ABC-type Fe3+ transport system permease subunit
MPVAGVTTIVLGLVAALAIASCVIVIAVQLWQTSAALAEIDAGLAQLPPALPGLEPAMDAVNGSLVRVAESAGEAVPVRR